MPKCTSSGLWIVVIVSACLFPLTPTACARGGPMLKKRLKEAMAKVREGETSTSRTDAAEYLATLTRGINPSKVDDTTLAELVSLLETQEDSVRYWVAASLGNLGPRAKMAVPTLLKLLPQVDCVRGSLTSAPAIRLALERMGETPPPPKCGSKSE
jgi:hypothetical protein